MRTTSQLSFPDVSKAEQLLATCSLNSSCSLKQSLEEQKSSLSALPQGIKKTHNPSPPFSRWLEKGNKLWERGANIESVGVWREEEMHNETLSLENTDKSTSESEKDKKKKHPNMPFLMIHHQLLMVSLHFSPSSFLLPSSFCQISSAGPSCSWSLAFRLHYSPQAGPSSIIFLCLFPTPACLLPSWGPKPSLRPVISDSHLLSFSIPSSCLQRPDLCLEPLLSLRPQRRKF